MVNFSKHQNPHQNEKNSDLPDNPHTSTQEDSCATPVQAPEQDESDPALTLTSSLIPSSLIPESEEKEDIGQTSDETPPVAPVPKPPPPRKPPQAEVDRDFDERFYGPYPRHVKRDEALKAWVKLTPSDRDLAVTALAVWLEQSAFAQELTFVPYPASWLNGGRWKDDPDAVNPPKPIEWPDWIRKRINVHLQECAVEKRDPFPYPGDLQRAMDAYAKSLRVAA